MSKRKTYSEAMEIKSFEERFKYLFVGGKPFEETFGSCRYLNQIFYKSQEWRNFRREIIIRDSGYDLAHPDFPVYSDIYIHHINPISLDDIKNRRSVLIDPDNVICCSFKTHEGLHYSGESRISKIIERFENDMIPWR